MARPLRVGIINQALTIPSGALGLLVIAMEEMNNESNTSI
jgi:hypothetical protein